MLSQIRQWWQQQSDCQEAVVGPSVLAQLPLDAITRVEFYKRDMLTVDDICCDVWVNNDLVWTFDEDMEGWQPLIEHLEQLPGFKTNWYAAVVNPPFVENRLTAWSAGWR